jgi:hypothetical protein
VPVPGEIDFNAASTTATNLTTKKTRLLSIDAQNKGAAAAFLRLYDKATTPAPGAGRTMCR